MTVWKASDVNGLDSIVTRVAVRCRFDYFVENCGVSWVALENFKSEVSQSRASQMFLGLVQQGVDARNLNKTNSVNQGEFNRRPRKHRG